MPRSKKLGVNVDHIATLRQARGTSYPDPVEGALLAQEAGADLITVHLREDRRHIQERDVEMLLKMLKVSLNLEMACTEEMVVYAETHCPAKACLVPEKREELTTEGGLDVASQVEPISDIVSRLSNAGIEVSLFIDPDKAQIDAAKQTSAPIIELHTGRYADATNINDQDQELERLKKAAAYAAKLGLIVNAGHGLTIHNVERIAKIPEIHELNIGHSIIAKSLFCGIRDAVSEMRSKLYI